MVVYIYVTRLVGEKDKGVAISAYFTTRILASIVANPVIGFFAEHFGFRPMFLTIACLATLGLAAFWTIEHRSAAQHASPL